MADINTSFSVEYELKDTRAADDASITISNNQPFGNKNLLPFGATDFQYKGTLEHNLFLLDGSTIPYEDEEVASGANSIGWFSTNKSDDNGDFSNTSMLITFSEFHASIGLQLDFVHEFPHQVHIEWYRGDLLIMAGTYEVSELQCRIFEPVYNYNKITIQFLTATPNRFIKLNAIYFGYQVVFDEKHITEGKLIEEMDKTSSSLPVNELDFSFYDKNRDYNFGNGNGLHQFVQSGQVVYPYEYIEGVKTQLGIYYLKQIDSDNDKISFVCQSILGMMDSITYYLGEIYTNKKAGLIIESIFAVAGIENYTIDTDTYNIELSGTIVPDTCRNCLQQVLFACQSKLVCKRDGTIKIYYEPENDITGVLYRKTKISTKVTKLDYVTGVEVKYHKYELDSEDGQVIEFDTVNCTTGNNLIIFDAPYTNVSVSSGTIIDVGTYYCVVSCNEDSEVVVSGLAYLDTEVSSRVLLTELDASSVENIVTYNTTLGDGDRAKVIAQKLLNEYYNFKLKLDVQYLANEEQIDENWVVQNSDYMYDNYFANFERIETDVVGGFVATATMRGFYDTSNNYYFADGELKAKKKWLDTAII